MISSVYGPVESRRFGASLGIDLICGPPACCFRCVYCQLGRIEHHTLQRQLFVPTDKLQQDLDAGDWRGAVAATFSGSGEPTLAANLGPALELVARRTGLRTIVLTGGALLGEPAVADALQAADEVSVKLDAADERTFERVNRPVRGLCLTDLLAGLRRFRGQYRGRLSIQVMLLPWTLDQTAPLARLLADLRPDEVQLLSPSRPVPLCWRIEARGAHGAQQPFAARRMQTITPEEGRSAARLLAQATGLDVRFVG